MTTLAEVREGMGTALRSIPDLAVHDYIGAVYNPPFAVLRVGDIDQPQETFSRTGMIALPVEVWLFVSRPSDDLAQISLDSFLDWTGESSVKLALTSDQTLGGVAQSVQWDSFRNLGADEVAGLGYFGGVWGFTVRVQMEKD